MTRVVVLGFGPPPAPAAGAELVLRPDADGPVALCDAVAGHLDAGAVLAAYPAWSPEPHLHDLQVVRSSLETTRLVPLPIDLPPLAGAIAAGLLATAWASAPTEQVLGSLDALTSRVGSVAWLGSVGGLDHLPVSVKLHARSAIPGAAFVAIATGPNPRVVAGSRRSPQLPIGLAEPGTALSLAAGERGDIEVVRDALGRSGWRHQLTEVASSPLGRAYWGTDRHVEIVRHPVDLTAAADSLLADVDSVECPTCGRRSPLDTCPFCHRQLAGAGS